MHARIRGEYPIADLAQINEKTNTEHSSEVEEIGATEKEMIYR